MMALAYPIFIWLLVMIPIALFIFIRFHRNKKDKQSKIFVPDAWKRLNVGKGWQRTKNRFLLELVALILILAALAGPRVGTEIRELKREGVDIIVALDLSRSMKVQDVSPDRLTRARLEIRKLINNLKGDRIGLIAFAGIAHLQCPLTLDHAAASMMLNVMDETLLPVQGTALAEAINIAVKSFPEEEIAKEKALIIISDGEDHEQNVADAATKARDAGITIYTLGVGTLKGGPIPMLDKKGNLIDYKRNASNQIVTSQLQENNLLLLSDLTGGLYYRLYETKDPLNRIYSDIMNMERSEYKTHDFSKYIELYQIFLTLAFVILLLNFIFTSNILFKFKKSSTND